MKSFSLVINQALVISFIRIIQVILTDFCARKGSYNLCSYKAVKIVKMYSVTFFFFTGKYFWGFDC